MSNYYSDAYYENRLESIQEEIFRENPTLEEDSTEYEEILRNKIDSWEYENNNPSLSASERNQWVIKN